MANDASDGAHPYSVEWTDAGERWVRWNVGSPERPEYVQHNFPDAVTHHYSPSELNEDVLLYCGEFNYPNDSWPFYGDVRFRWSPSPHVRVHGKRWSLVSDLPQFLEHANAAGVSQQWTAPSHIEVALDGSSLPAQPRQGAEIGDKPGELSFSISDHVEQELGDPSALDAVTFFVPNGWDAFDRTGVCNPNNPRRCWHGRMETTGAGWSVTIDCDSAMTPPAWRALKDAGGYRFTHIGRLVLYRRPRI
jgi:hypothetical protein